jgi:hypothetical protein
MPASPFKLNQDRRRHIPRQTHKVTNWPAYDASLRQRGSLTVWFTDEAIEAWAAEPRTTRGGQPWYSALAILTALTLRAVFRLAYHQAEGLIGSIVGLLGLTLRVPDHTTLSRRAATLKVPQPRPHAGRRGDAEPLHLLVDSTGLSCAARASGWPRSTARASAGRGGSFISAWMPPRAGCRFDLSQRPESHARRIDRHSSAAQKSPGLTSLVASLSPADLMRLPCFDGRGSFALLTGQHADPQSWADGGLVAANPSLGQAAATVAGDLLPVHRF